MALSRLGLRKAKSSGSFVDFGRCGVYETGVSLKQIGVLLAMD